MDAIFIKNPIKGKITDIVFEQMLRESGGYTILHSGYEYTLPAKTLARRGILILKNIGCRC